jgi:hypothetical protein
MDQRPNTEPLHHDNDDSPEAFIERMRSLYGIEKTSFDELQELAKTEPDSERFQVFLDDLTYEALSENAEFNENREAMTSRKLSAKKQVELRDKQRALFSNYRQAIIQEAGLPTEVALTEAEKSKKKVQATVDEVLDSHETAEPVQVLETLGIITHDDEGKEIFTYPQGLFPKATDDKWDTYLETVRNHLRIERAVHHGTTDKAELGEADTTRRMAHNAVTRDIHEILGLDKLADSSWDFEKTRNLLAKMRDTRFPTVETAEKAVTENAILVGIAGRRALEVLHRVRSTRLSDMHE